jgi:hypothetical protein
MTTDAPSSLVARSEATSLLDLLLRSDFGRLWPDRARKLAEASTREARGQPALGQPALGGQPVLGQPTLIARSEATGIVDVWNG